MFEEQTNLPAPPRPLILFDSDCAFCGAQAGRIRRLDEKNQFDFASMDDPDILKRYPQLSRLEGREGMRILDTSGRAYVAADAAHQIARRLPRFRWIAWTYHVPGLRGIFRLIYHVIARNRHRLGPR